MWFSDLLTLVYLMKAIKKRVVRTNLDIYIFISCKTQGLGNEYIKKNSCVTFFVLRAHVEKRFKHEKLTHNTSNEGNK